jgi:hypothetical protein
MGYVLRSVRLDELYESRRAKKAKVFAKTALALLED